MFLMDSSAPGLDSPSINLNQSFFSYITFIRGDLGRGVV